MNPARNRTRAYASDTDRISNGVKIAFLGKGGSGKSTLATAMVRYLYGSGKRVLAIDADHNMDLSYNLGVDTLPRYLGSDPAAIRRHASVPEKVRGYTEAASIARENGVSFRLSPPDPYTGLFAHEVRPRLHIMAAGPHTDIVRSGEHCSHSLAAPLKIYLPLLQLEEDEAVVIDERAGTDPVATGILNGVDLAIIVAEPTVHSVRVAGQIAHELTLATVPFGIVANKVRGEDAHLGRLPQKPLAHIPFSADGPDEALLESIIARS